MIVKENTNIVQANFLIENRPKFTKDETRLYLTIIGAINKDDTDFKPLEIPVSEFADLWGMELKTAYNKIKAALHGLVKKDFFVEGINPSTGKKRFLSAAYLSMAAYEEGQGYATVEIAQGFKPYLIALKEKYTQYVLENIMDLTTVNAIRNYELLKQYESLGVRIFTVEDYKKALGIENKYSLNADLRRYVLEPAREEINENTDIRIDFEITGRGTKAKIKFTISENKKLSEHPVLEPEEAAEQPDENQISLFDIPKYEYSNAYVYSLAEACDFEFNQTEMELLLTEISKKSFGFDLFTEKHLEDRARYEFVQKAYRTLNYQASKINIENRVTYLQGIIRNMDIE